MTDSSRIVGVPLKQMLYLVIADETPEAVRVWVAEQVGWVSDSAIHYYTQLFNTPQAQAEGYGAGAAEGARLRLLAWREAHCTPPARRDDT